MWSIEEIFSKLDESFDRIQEVVQDMDAETYGQEQAEGKWSPALHIEHLLLTDMVITQMISGDGKAAEPRDSAKVMDHVNKSFANMEKRYTAFGPLIPQGLFPDRSKAFDQWGINRDQLKSVLRDQNPYSLAEGFIHPLVGEPMSRLEWASFCVIHADRHRMILEGKSI